MLRHPTGKRWPARQLTQTQLASAVADRAEISTVQKARRRLAA
jgi:hypothetical protein